MLDMTILKIKDKNSERCDWSKEISIKILKSITLKDQETLITIQQLWNEILI